MVDVDDIVVHGEATERASSADVGDIVDFHDVGDGIRDSGGESTELTVEWEVPLVIGNCRRSRGLAFSRSPTTTAPAIVEIQAQLIQNHWTKCMMPIHSCSSAPKPNDEGPGMPNFFFQRFATRFDNDREGPDT